MLAKPEKGLKEEIEVDRPLPQLPRVRLTTAEILYHLPDHPSLLQIFVWQQFDVAPEFPKLRRFLDFWVRNIEGKLHSVRVAEAPLNGRRRFRAIALSRSLH